MSNFYPTYHKTVLLFIFISGFIVLKAQQTNNKDYYSYLVYLPKDYNDSIHKNYPIIIYLHGASLRGDNIEMVKRYGLPAAIEKGAAYPFIVISPQCPATKNWTTDPWLDSLLPVLFKKYRIDTKRFYLTGISLGGYGTWDIAIKYNRLFAAIAPLCGGSTMATNICRLNNMPILTYHGTADKSVNISETEKLVEALGKCNNKVEFHKLKKVGHDLTFLYHEPYIYDWFLKYSLLQINNQ